jgi:DNA-binding MarR family transcriptional regulator
MDKVNVEEMEVLLDQIMKGLHPHPSRKPVLHNITFAQMRIVWLLGKHGQLSMSQIAQMIGVSRATISSVVNRLVKSKFVSRVRDEKDRRIIRLKLTGKGKKFIQNHKSLRRKHVVQLLEKLSPYEQKRFVACLGELNGFVGRAR